MDYIYTKARAKINVAIDITAKREDGYHEMRMIMQTLSLYDGMYIKKTEKSSRLKLVTNLHWLPTDERNLAYRAADLLIKQFNIREGVFIDLKKIIPVSAGLAGGSSDCAAALVGMRNLFNLPLSNRELMVIGKELGADVPYCIMRGTALAEGIGERLTALPPMPDVFVVLAKPPIIVSTGDVFKNFLFENVTQRPDIEKMLYYIRKSDINGICGEFCNVLESITAKQYPIIDDLKHSLVRNGAIASLMSGSGPSVFGFFRTRAQAAAASKSLRHEYPNMRDIFVTQLYNVPL